LAWKVKTQSLNGSGYNKNTTITLELCDYTKDILYKVAIEAVSGSKEVAVHKIEFDSRKIEVNDVFVAIRGSVSDGHDYIQKQSN
jgi:UDP-N-acetylmuramyl tripeptide synthase